MGKSMILGYCHVGAFERLTGLERQRRDLAAIGAQEFFCEKSAIFGKRTELERAIERARKGVGFRILNTPIDTSTTTGRMILGSAPRWSLGISPLRAALWDLSLGWA